MAIETTEKKKEYWVKRGGVGRNSNSGPTGRKARPQAAFYKKIGEILSEEAHKRFKRELEELARAKKSITPAESKRLYEQCYNDLVSGR